MLRKKQSAIHRRKNPKKQRKKNRILNSGVVCLCRPLNRFTGQVLLKQTEKNQRKTNQSLITPNRNKCSAPLNPKSSWPPPSLSLRYWGQRPIWSSTRKPGKSTRTFLRRLSVSAELTNERIISNYEDNYLQSAFAHFDREMADIYSLNEDIVGASIYNYSGEALYEAERRIQDLNGDKLDRVQAVYPSVKTTEGRVMYLEKTDEQLHWHAIDQKRPQAHATQ